MSKPLGKSVLSELIRAMSSLNMYPDGDYSKIGNEDGDKYLTQVDDNVGHSYEHIVSSIDVLQEMRGEILQLKYAIMHEDIPNERKYALNDKINSIMERF